MAFAKADNIFWKTILERLSIEDAPFFTKIEDGFFLGIPLREATPEQVVSVCKQKWDIPEPLCQWKDIKKEYVRSSLIYNYVTSIETEANTRKDLTLQIADLLSSKKLKNEDIEIVGGKIVHINL